jgi:glyoxylase-like metal-dependent hydrolase (beta-lactamase superfamily II)
MVHVEQFTFNGFQENTYVLFDDNGKGLIVDPGCYERQEESDLLAFIEQRQIEIVAVLNTHAHIDHILGNQFVTSHFGVDLYLHEKDLNTLRSVESYAHVYGFNAYKVSPEPTQFLEDGQLLSFGEIELKVLFTPGHAPGHVVFYCEKGKFVINGDVLFQGSFGRVDLPGGDLETLKKSIFNIMFKLPEETVVYCGHGPSTTIGQEKRSNYIHQF